MNQNIIKVIIVIHDDYLISNYSVDSLYNVYIENINGRVISSTSLPFLTKPVKQNYFKDWRIGVSSDNFDGDDFPTNIKKGVVVSHDPSTVTNTIPSGTMIVSETNTDEDTGNTDGDGNAIIITRRSLTITPRTKHCSFTK